MIKRINTLSELSTFKKQLIEIYVKSFSEPPWYEVFMEDDVWHWFCDMTNYPNNIILLSLTDGEINGATFNFPAGHKPDLCHFLTNGLSVKEVCYFAEIFVNPLKRNLGIGKQLHLQRLSIAKDEGFKAVLERTNPDSKMYRLIQETGFQTVGKQEVMSKKNKNGEILTTTDQRIISLKTF